MLIVDDVTNDINVPVAHHTIMAFAAALGMIDVLCAITLFCAAFGFPIPHLQAVTGIALVAKGCFFIADILSVIDVIIGFAMLALLWIEAPLFALAIAVYLALKALASFM